nr:PREDICTED: ER membrane protein complex subunit 6-like isoform X2 [Musa acuminata subsp. malaccensis]
MVWEGDRGASGGAEDDLPIFNAENLQSNVKSIYYSRTFLSIIGGVIAGIWGFTGFTGFIFYFLVMAAASFGLATQAKFSVCTYFDSWNRIFLDGIFGGLMYCGVLLTYMF